MQEVTLCHFCKICLSLLTHPLTYYVIISRYKYVHIARYTCYNSKLESKRVGILILPDFSAKISLLSLCSSDKYGFDGFSDKIQHISTIDNNNTIILCKIFNTIFVFARIGLKNISFCSISIKFCLNRIIHSIWFMVHYVMLCIHECESEASVVWEFLIRVREGTHAYTNYLASRRKLRALRVSSRDAFIQSDTNCGLQKDRYLIANMTFIWTLSPNLTAVRNCFALSAHDTL